MGTALGGGGNGGGGTDEALLLDGAAEVEGDDLLLVAGAENMASKFDMPGIFLKCCGRLAAEPPADCNSRIASCITLAESGAGGTAAVLVEESAERLRGVE